MNNSDSREPVFPKNYNYIFSWGFYRNGNILNEFLEQKNEYKNSN